MKSIKLKKVYIAIIFIVLLIVSFGYMKYREISNIEYAFNNQKRLEEAAKKYEEIRARQNKDIQNTKNNIQQQFNENRINILFLGFDKNKYREDQYRLFRPDGIILVSLNMKNDTVDMISFPRDSRVWIAHRPGKDKINASFYYGYDLGGGKTPEEREQLGYQYCVDTVSEFLGDIYIDNYVTIDMDGLVKVIDKIGGVKMNIKEDFLDERYGDKVIIEAGNQTLNGEQFLFLVRDRDKVNEKDKVRAARTQEAFVAVYNQLKSQNMVTLLPELYSSFTEYIDTDLNITEMSSLAMYAQKIKFNNINMYVIDGKYEFLNNYIYYIPDEQSRKELVKSIFGVDFVAKR